MRTPLRMGVIVLLFAPIAPAWARGGGDYPASARLVDTMPFVDVGENAENNNAFDYNCPGAPGEYDGKDQWYKIVPTQTMSVRITTCSPVTDYDTKLYVMRDTVSAASVIACNDDSCTGGLGLPYIAEIESVTLEAGHTYYIVVDAYSQSDEGTFRLTIEFGGVSPAPCTGDITGDSAVNVDDLNAVLGAWQLSVPANTGPDASGDGVVNVDDLNIVLSNWQGACT